MDPISCPESDRLLEEVRAKARQELKLGRGSHWLNVASMFLTLAATVFAVVWGFVNSHSGRSTAVVALIPGAIALFASNMKFERRCDWHYKRYYALEALRRRLELTLAQQLVNPEIVKIAEDLSKLELDMEATWERTLSLDWDKFQNASFAKPRDPEHKS